MVPLAVGAGLLLLVVLVGVGADLHLVVVVGGGADLPLLLVVVVVEPDLLLLLADPQVVLGLLVAGLLLLLEVVVGVDLLPLLLPLHLPQHAGGPTPIHLNETHKEGNREGDDLPIISTLK